MRPASKHQVNSYVRPFLASAMVAGGLLQLAAPIYAAGVAAGSDISNTATASYEDPNNSGVPLNTVSNTVSIKVEKVAGIFIDSLGATDVTEAGKYKPGDIVNFDFLLTNKGNSAVKFSIPNFATVNTAGDFQKVQYSTDNGVTWKDITGAATDPTVMPVVPVDGTMKARVVVIVRAGTPANTPLNVQLGQTATAPTVAAPTENVVRANDASDVYTIDITDGVTLDPSTSLAVAPGNAINGVREAAALQTVNVSAENKAFVDINMTGATTFVDPTDPKKNKVTYDITVKVDPNAPTTGPDAGKNPADLGATSIKLDPGTGLTTVNRVLISDPVPAGTTPTSLVAPNGWTAVYSITDPNNVSPTNPVVWKTGTLPTTGVTFVGFIKNDDQPLAKSPTAYTGFKVELQTISATSTAPTIVNNIANIFGTTPNADKTPDLTKPITDQTGTPNVNDSVPTTAVPIVVIITPQGTRTVFNGPQNKPEAIGSDGSQNSDFTNKSAEIQLSDAKVLDPATGELKPLGAFKTVAFNNTVENKGTVTTDIYVLPTVPVDKASLPDLTEVAISYGSDTRTYIYHSDGTYTLSTTDAAKLPIVIPAVPVAAPGIPNPSYGVSIKLPANTPQLKAYSAPITAFADSVVPGTGITAVPSGINVSSNTTIDTVYTGYIKLEKEARILTDATTAATSTVPFSTKTLATKPLPGQFIQYRIKYTNISTGGGTDNVLLKAGKLNIIEDGASPNTWAALTDNVTGSAADNSGGVVKFFNAAGSTSPDVAGVSKYVVDMNAAGVVIAPQATGSFTFLRQVK